MSYANHPLLVASVPNPNTFTGTISATACSSTISPGGGTFTINPKTENPNLAVGDICLIQIGTGNQITNSPSLRGPDGWNELCGHQGNNENGQTETRANVNLYWKVYEAADDTNHTWTVITQGSYCWNVAALKNVSKRCPFPYVRAYKGNSLFNVSNWAVNIPPIPTQGSSYQNLMVWMAINAANNASYSNPVMDFDPATSASYLGPSENSLIASVHNYYTSYYSFAGYTVSDLLFYKGTSTSTHQNLIPTMNPAVVARATSVGGAHTNLNANADQDRSSGWTTPSWIGDADTGQHYVEWSFDATEGDQIVILIRSSVSRDNDQGMGYVLSLLNPSSSYIAQSAIWDQHGAFLSDASGNFSELSSVPTFDHRWGHAHTTGSSFSSPWPAYTVHVIDSAPATGTYTIRLNSIYYLTSSLDQYQSGGGQWVDYVGVAINGAMPSFCTTSGSEQTTGATWAYGGTASAPFTFSPQLDCPWVDTYGLSFPSGGYSHVAAVLGDPNATFPSPRLQSADGHFSYAEQPLGETTSYLTARSGSTAMFPPGTSKVNDNNVLMYIVDRPIFASYYATEDATSATAGKYYFEVEINKTTSRSNTFVGLGSPIFSHVLTDGNAGGGLLYNANGTISDLKTGTTVTSGLSTFTAGDIMGVAISYPDDTIAFYLNGSLEWSGTISGDMTYDMMGQDFTVFIANNPVDNLGVDINLTGPFTYTKPSGYVAYDWTNEEA